MRFKLKAPLKAMKSFGIFDGESRSAFLTLFFLDTFSEHSYIKISTKTDAKKHALCSLPSSDAKGWCSCSKCHLLKMHELGMTMFSFLSHHCSFPPSNEKKRKRSRKEEEKTDRKLLFSPQSMQNRSREDGGGDKNMFFKPRINVSYNFG
ncbi:hypothetical protein AVEN_229200-1 [Araneus ventricosus]|uniref:Uncharacterized protein n=1 Tax=Araneus ventricosus TaxID=182803 RepID=A0A4Y2SDY6_ARAVE|nr:hypothetical protein AVEN_229200-1 [Araneus ventricosus]